MPPSVEVAKAWAFLFLTLAVRMMVLRNDGLVCYEFRTCLTGIPICPEALELILIDRMSKINMFLSVL